MAAPKGNQFWKLRSKHGRDKIFNSPELLWSAACEYFEWCDENPLQEVKLFNTKDFGVVEHRVDKLRAYTIQGLCMYLECNHGYFNEFERRMRDKLLEDPNDEVAQGFSVGLARIRDAIFRQKFEGAAADLLNPNIIARELALFDKPKDADPPKKKITVNVIKSKASDQDPSK